MEQEKHTLARIFWFIVCCLGFIPCCIITIWQIVYFLFLDEIDNDLMIMNIFIKFCRKMAGVYSSYDNYLRTYMPHSGEE